MYLTTETESIDETYPLKENEMPNKLKLIKLESREEINNHCEVLNKEKIFSNFRRDYCIDNSANQPHLNGGNG